MIRDGLPDLIKLQKAGVRVDALESEPALGSTEIAFVTVALAVIEAGGAFSYVELEAYLRLMAVRASLWPRVVSLVRVYGSAVAESAAKAKSRSGG